MSSHAFLEFKELCNKHNIKILDEVFFGCFNLSLKFKLRCSQGHTYESTPREPYCKICRTNYTEECNKLEIKHESKEFKVEEFIEILQMFHELPLYFN